jgi:hypothetical protein
MIYFFIQWWEPAIVAAAFRVHYIAEQHRKMGIAAPRAVLRPRWVASVSASTRSFTSRLQSSWFTYSPCPQVRTALVSTLHELP